MIIIPEIETVVILVPRTGTSSLKRAIAARYPRSTMLYRHMEADGVPLGYDRWHRVGVVREPVSRLWSLYRYLGNIGEGRSADGLGKWEPEYVARQRASVEMPFDQWIVDNRLVFTSPYDQNDGLRFYPGFCVRHALPENRKSQFTYLRPDLGTDVVRYDDVDRLYAMLDVEPARENAAPDRGETPSLSPAARDHIAAFFAWDTAATVPLRAAA